MPWESIIPKSLNTDPKFSMLNLMQVPKVSHTQQLNDIITIAAWLRCGASLDFAGLVDI